MFTRYLWRCRLYCITLLSCVTIGLCCFLLRHKFYNFEEALPRTEKYSNNHQTDNDDDVAKQTKIVLGTVSCRKPRDKASNIEAAVMLKSVLISARFYNVSQVELHIFLEWSEDDTFFLKTLKDFKIPPDIMNVSMSFHSAVDIVPVKFHEWMIYHKRFRCGFSRMFFSTALPDLDSILYLDTDFIVTGNILELWNHLGKMKGREAVGAVANNAPVALPVTYHLHNCFSGVPFVPPKGINSGLMLMNLTRMRAANWVDKISLLFETYTKLTMVDDQRLLNIIFSFDRGLLHILPCQFNIRCSPCDHGFICKDAYKDQYGIGAVHGANNQFDKGSRFYYLYRLYKRFDMAKQDVIKDLFIPVKTAREPRTRKGVWKCDPSVNQLLYRNILKNETIN